MPKRTIPLVTGFYYHIYNRGLNKQKVFFNPQDYSRFLGSLWYYRFSSTPYSYTRYANELSVDEKRNVTSILLENNCRLVDIVAYCIMPNHYHLVLRQIEDGGISKFIGNIQNSHTRYENIKTKTTGSIYSARFKNKLIEDEDILKHIIRYVVLNPYTSVIVDSKEKLMKYNYSSIKESFVDSINNIIEQKILNSLFNSRSSFLQFVLDYTDYQRRLKTIKDLILEDNYSRGYKLK